MILKYTDLHNKILRDAEDPEKIAQKLIDNGYCVVGVNVHNEGDEVRNKKHYYKFFETHFEMFTKRGLLMLPAVEIKLRDKNFSILPDLIEEFSRKYIPVHHKGKIFQVPFLVFVHGGLAEVNKLTVKNNKADLLCHPDKDEGIFTQENADDATENNVGIEINYREYKHCKNKKNHKNKVLDTIRKVKNAGGKLFLFSATIKEEELVHIKELVDYGKVLHENLVDESIRNVQKIIVKKYSNLLNNIEFDIGKIKA